MENQSLNLPLDKTSYHFETPWLKIAVYSDGSYLVSTENNITLGEANLNCDNRQLFEDLKNKALLTSKR